MTLRCDHLGFAYGSGRPVLEDISLELAPGLVTGLFGPNGSGKSTLLRCMSGALLPQSGRVLLDEAPIATLARRQIARHIAIVPQDTPADVPLSVREVAMLGRYPHGDLWSNQTADDQAIVAAALDRVGVEHLADRPFAHLSGGERQRVVIARALAQDAPILLLDEPNSHLDLAHQLEVYRLAQALAREGKAVLIICHDLLVSPLFIDTAVLLHAGQVAATGRPADVLSREAMTKFFATRATIAWEEHRITADLRPPPG